MFCFILVYICFQQSDGGLCYSAQGAFANVGAVLDYHRDWECFEHSGVGSRRVGPKGSRRVGPKRNRTALHKQQLSCPECLNVLAEKQMARLCNFSTICLTVQCLLVALSYWRHGTLQREQRAWSLVYEFESCCLNSHVSE